MSILPYLGANVNQSNVDEIIHRGFLEEDETLLALFDGIILDERGQRAGGLALSDFLALTDRGVILWVRGFWNDAVDTFAWPDVDVAETGTWGPIHGRVRLGLRLPAPEARQKRIKIKGVAEDEPSERVIINTLDYMPSEDVPVLAHMIEWIGDQVIAGTPTAELQATLNEMFPRQERVRLLPRSFQPPMPQPEEQPQQTKQGWWSFGGKKKSASSSNTPESLVAAYEYERRGSSPRSTSNVSATVYSSDTPARLPDQPSIHEVTRGLRLLLDAPYRLKGTMVRANQVMSGTNELLENMQDPEVRRRAIAGLRFAIDQQDRQQTGLGTVASAARAMLRFGERITQPRSETSDNEAEQETPAATRNIEVRAVMRQRGGSPATSQSASAPESVAMPADDNESAVTSTGPVVRSSASMRRKINIRRSDEADEPQSNGTTNGHHQMEVVPDDVDVSSNGGAHVHVADEVVAAATDGIPVIAPVRRIVISRSGTN